MIAEIEQRLEDKVLERSNAELLQKLITQVDSDDEAIKIMSLGTTYKKSSLHYKKRLEKMGNTIELITRYIVYDLGEDIATDIHNYAVSGLQNYSVIFKSKN